MNLSRDKDVEEVCISDIMVLSGVRPAGRTIDQTHNPRPRNGLLYIWRGEALFWEKGRLTVTAGDGELLFIPKGHHYRMQYSKANTTFVLVNFELFCKNGEALSLFDAITPLKKDNEGFRIADVMTKLELCGADLSFAAEFRRKELLYRLLAMVFQDRLPPFTDQERSSRIFAGTLLLKQSYLENLPVEEFAKACNISISLFRELFRKQYGMSPVQYRNCLRISRAKELLSEESCTVAEAAYASGFENIGYFCNYYKKITGETPAQTKLRSNDLV